ncbi:hypothetical protein SAMN04488040_2579 [Sulfitobacter marinus]|uniref:Uncharacterized protein n=1 Tax=Sulfitobacter marinus TaxID=394264 RepID=A0A1I6U9N1_9RHOB|nr:hypothetical protein [Sulfitobacter marinus]SFS97987.1 hypothetical protein SAMN04488040_2579 [Sulfitobacter marinus]
MPLILIAIIIVFLIVAYFTRRGADTRACRWRKNASRDKGSLHYYRCAACGAEAYTATKDTPKDCKSKVTSRPL